MPGQKFGPVEINESYQLVNKSVHGRSIRRRLGRRAVNEMVEVYQFREPGFAPTGNIVVSIAPIDAVVAVYGGGGIFKTGGLSKAFQGTAFFRNESTGACYAGVWGSRKASKFRNSFRTAGFEVRLIREKPSIRLVLSETTGARRLEIALNTDKNPA
jgi:hypothetical protein